MSTESIATRPSGKSPIARRLIIATVLFSSAITLVTTSVQLYVDYNRDLSAIESTLDQIEASSLETLTLGVWSLDGNWIQIQIDGLLQIPDVEFLKVDAGQFSWEAGVITSTSTITLSYPLRYQALIEDEYIGDLTIIVGLDATYLRLLKNGLQILAGNAIKTFLVAGFLLLLFQSLITRHLTKLTEHAESFAEQKPFNPLTLDRGSTKNDDNDELARLVSAVNDMCRRLCENVATRDAQHDALKNSQERFHDFAMASSDWLWETDAEGRFSWVSEEPRYHLGKKPQELSIDPQSDAGWGQYDEALREQREFRDFDYAYLRSDGKTRYLRLSGVPTHDKQGRFAGHLGVASDVTQARKVEESMLRAQRLEAVGQLTGGIAHDFNNLMAIVMGNAELLERTVRGDKSASKHVEQIIASVQRGSSLTGRLLAFSRQQALTSDVANAAEIIDGLGDMIQRALGETIALQINHASDLWLATFDIHQFENALVNLAINARDAMPGGGTLLLESGNINVEDEYAKQDDGLLPGEYVIVTVTDGGCGMSSEVLEKVFEPFFTTKDVGQGSGLGLSMVYGFAKQSKGHVSIYSEVGHGTTVKLYLPRAAGKEIQRFDQESGPILEPGTEHILIVEDNSDVRKVSARILRDQGYEVTEAQDCEEAIKHLEGGQQFDLLFADIVLSGGVSGVGVAKKARQIQPQIKVLFTTGYAMNALRDMEEFDPTQPLVVVTKPFRGSDLLRKVRSLLDTGDASGAYRPLS